MARTLPDDPGPQTTIGKKAYKCAICHKSYARADRLKRHSLCHDATGSEHKCRHCNKGFTRKDVLKRHEQAHLHVREDGTATLQAHSSVLRTCAACRRARARCLGGQPCSYCASRSQVCIYPLRKSRSRRIYRQLGSASPESSAEIHAEIATDTHHASTRVNDGHEAGDSIVPSLPDQMVITPVLGDEDPAGLLNAIEVPLQSFIEPPNHDALPWQSELQTVDVPSSAAAVGDSLDMSDVDRINWLCFDDTMSLTDLAMLQYDHDLDGLTTIQPEPNLTSVTLAAFGEAHPRSDTVMHQLPMSYSPASDAPPSIASRASQKSARQTSGLSRTSRGCLYTDGKGARSSTVDRRRSFRESIASPAASLETHHTNPIALQESLDEKLRQIRLGSVDTHELAAHVVNDLYKHFAANIVPGDRPVLSLSNLDCSVELEIIQWFIQLAFDNFDPAHPFIDRQLLHDNPRSWELCIALAAIGAGFAASAHFTLCGDALAQMLANILQSAHYTSYNAGDLTHLTALALLVIRLGNSQQSLCQQTALHLATTLYRKCLQFRLLEESIPDGPTQDRSVEEAWMLWRSREACRRTGIMIWTLDFAQSNAFAIPSQLPVDRLQIRAPCSDALWEADTAQDWHKTYYGDTELEPLATDFLDEERSRPTLQHIQEQLWSNLHGPEVTSPFALSHIVCMLVRKVQDALTHFTQVPKLAILGATETALSKFYPPAEPTFTKWRNTACDCLDVLHWEASCVAAKEAGAESPLFLHLHLARLLMLSPVLDLCNIAQAHCVSKSTSLRRIHLGPTIPVSDSYRMLHIWANTDRYKARLALVHAGATFWHTRRYSSDVLMQPFTIYLATLALWAYGIIHGNAGVSMQSSSRPTTESAPLELSEGTLDSAEQPGTAAGPRSNTSSTRPRRMPRWIQLDRPVDDELVQYFIRTGDMRVVLECIDDLCAPDGPYEILTEGAALLEESATIWSISQQYATELRCMIPNGWQSRSV